MKQTIRIIGGRYRGKKLSFPALNGLRPTPDRVRETVFNWLMHDIYNARCLDAFAGSGALGFEAFSRGAAKVVMIEQSGQAFKNLVHLNQSFPSTNATIIQADACDYIKQAKDQFDIIFLDPPFNKNILPQCIQLLEQSSLLVDNGLLYIESEKEILLNPARWNKRKYKQSGQVAYGLYQKKSSASCEQYNG